MFEDIREDIKSLGLPTRDCFDMPTSTKTFADGSNFKIEIPTVNTIETMEAIFEESAKLNIRVDRITETYGIFRHIKAEISQMVKACESYGCEFVMSPGPRASYDTSATASSAQGKTIAYRLRGQEQIIRAIKDIKRAIDLGVKIFVLYDEGLLWLLNEMRKNNSISKEIKFKVSAHCGHGNPASFKLLESIGANSINTVRDLELPMIAALRATVNIPIDCHTDNPLASGGFIRVYEAPEIVRIASPVYLKAGNYVILAHGESSTAKDGIKMAQQASIVIEMIEKYYPQAKQSKGLI
jgi:hypothetical protein